MPSEVRKKNTEHRVECRILLARACREETIEKGTNMKALDGKRFVRLVIGLGCTALLAGCGPARQRSGPDLVWPPPPEEPRIKFVRLIYNEKDVKGQSSVLEMLIGKEERRRALVKPYGVAADKNGTVYVTDTGLAQLVIFDFEKKRMKMVGSAMGPGRLAKPIGVAVGGSGNVYVSDTRLDVVKVFDRNGDFLFSVGERGELSKPSGLAINDGLQRLYVVNTGSHNVKVYGLTGKFLFEFGTRGSDEGEFNYPSNIAVDRAGKVYICDSLNFRVQVFTPGGEFVREFGKIGDAPGEFSRPKGVAVDSEGHIYVADAAFSNLQIFDQAGRLLLYFGEMGNPPGNFYLPAGLGFGPDDKLYVADQFNRCIQVFQYLGGG